MQVTNQSLKFHSDALPENALLVQKLTGVERLSGPFRFELELISSDPAIDLDAALYQPAKLGVLQRLGPGVKAFRWFQGTLAQLEELEQGHGSVSYRAVLVPDLWRLGECWRSRVFQQKTVDEIVGEVLKKSLGFQSGQDFEWKLTRTKPGDRPSRPVYPEREYVVQYMESDLDFMQRWLEHEGIFYAFENDGTREKILFADSSGAYKPVDPRGSSYPYRPQGTSRSTGGEDGKTDAEDVLSFRCRAIRQPGKVRLDDYNWRDPAVSLLVEKQVHKKGTGIQLEYNNHYKTPEQGQAHAEVRAQEWTCRGAQFWGESTCRGFRPGRTFELTEHFRGEWNRTYLLTAVVHQAEQSINLEGSNVTAADYKNSFECIPADLEFRPERTVRWPTIHGVMHARVDGEGDGSVAELDEFGRYKVRIPWDENAKDAAPGKASRWIRMSQPYAGPETGFHFPLLKGTEVLLIHVDGDPDRPIIAGAVPDHDTVSPSNHVNPTQNKIKTPTGNVFLTDDHVDRNGFVFMDADRGLVQDFRHAYAGNGGDGGQGGGGGGEPRARLQRLATLAREGAPAADRAQALRALGEGVLAELDASPSGGNPVERLIAAGQPLHSRELPPGGGRGTDPQAPPAPPPPPPPDVPGLPLTPPDAAAEDVWGTGIQEYLTNTPNARSILNTGLVKLEGKTGKDLTKTYQLEARRFDEFLAISYAQSTADSSQAGIGEVTIKNCDQYIYVDNSAEYRYGTGGLSYTEANGNATVETVNNGNLTTTATVNGDLTQNFTRKGDLKIDNWNHGEVVSYEITLGGMAKFSFSGDATAQGEIRVGLTSRLGIQVGGMVEVSITLSAKAGISICVSAEATLSLVAGAKATLELIVAANSYTSLNAAGKFETEVSTTHNHVKIPNATEILIKEDKINLLEQKFTLSATKAEVSGIEQRVTKTEQDINANTQKISDNETTLNKVKTGLNDTINTLTETGNKLAATTNSLTHNVRAAANTLTSGIHVIA